MFANKITIKLEITLIKELYNRLDRIEKILEDNHYNEAVFLNIDETSDFIKMKKSSIYQLVFQRKIPFYKRGKLLLFKKAEIVRWIEEKKMDTLENLAERVSFTKIIDKYKNEENKLIYGKTKTNYRKDS